MAGVVSSRRSGSVSLCVCGESETRTTKFEIRTNKVIGSAECEAWRAGDPCFQSVSVSSRIEETSVVLTCETIEMRDTVLYCDIEPSPATSYLMQLPSGVSMDSAVIDATAVIAYLNAIPCWSPIVVIIAALGTCHRQCWKLWPIRPKLLTAWKEPGADRSLGQLVSTWHEDPLI